MKKKKERNIWMFFVLDGIFRFSWNSWYFGLEIILEKKKYIYIKWKDLEERDSALGFVLDPYKNSILSWSEFLVFV